MHAVAYQGVDRAGRQEAAPCGAAFALVHRVQRVQQAPQELLGIALLAVPPCWLHCCSLVQKPVHGFLSVPVLACGPCCWRRLGTSRYLSHLMCSSLWAGGMRLQELL